MKSVKMVSRDEKRFRVRKFIRQKFSMSFLIENHQNYLFSLISGKIGNFENIRYTEKFGEKIDRKFSISTEK